MIKKIKAMRPVLSAMLGLVALGWTAMAQVQTPPSSEPRLNGATTPPGTIIYRSTEVAVTPGSRLSTTALLPTGIAPKTNPSADEAIREVFKKTVQVASKNELGNVVDQLAGPDRERLESHARGNYPDFRSACEHFRDIWEDKYHDNFIIGSEDVVFGPQFVVMAKGEIRDPAALTDWPLNPTLGVPVTKTRTDVAAHTSEQVHLERGRDVAVAVFPASGDVPELTVSLVHEAPDYWKIDIPDTVSVMEIKDRLTQHLNWLSENQQQWPSDMDEGRRMVSRHVLLALYGQ